MTLAFIALCALELWFCAFWMPQGRAAGVPQSRQLMGAGTVAFLLKVSTGNSCGRKSLSLLLSPHKTRESSRRNLPRL